MYQMVVLVLEELEKWPRILDAWEDAGVTGVTILESAGLVHMRRLMTMRDDTPLMPSLSSLMHSQETAHRTIFTVVDSDELVDNLIRVTDSILGGLSRPHNGIMFVLPVSRAVGLRDK